MPLAWNEIRHRAIKFANENSKAASEAAEKQTFWNEFFEVFGIARKTVASFEAPVKKLTGHDGAIDLFWPGNLIVEHKSLGGKLDKAQSRAFEYIHALVHEGRHKEVPRYVIVSDFARMVLYDLEPDEQKDLPLFAGKRVQLAAEFNLADFYKNIRPFAFITGYKRQKLDPEDPANIEAAQIMADLHDALKAGNFLVITYRELRALELDVLKLKFGTQTEMKLDEVNKLSRVDVDQMFGIEIEEFPARIAEVALWLTSFAFPLRKSPHIYVGNALRMDWRTVLAPEKCSYVLGNPRRIAPAARRRSENVLG
ncbi:MAG TPA: type IIL restriction-modification enzyme MmeI [Verrucomicrobiae bacterium]